MLYCIRCAEKFGLLKSALQQFFKDCEICGKKCTTVHFRDRRMEPWKITKQARGR